MSKKSKSKKSFAGLSNDSDEEEEFETWEEVTDGDYIDNDQPGNDFDRVELSSTFTGRISPSMIEMVYESVGFDLQLAKEALEGMCGGSGSSGGGSGGTGGGRGGSNVSAVSVVSTIGTADYPYDPNYHHHTILDRDAFYNWSKVYRGLLKQNDLEEIWLQVQKDLCGEKDIRMSDLSDLASVYAQHKIDGMFDGSGAEESTVVTVKETEKPKEQADSSSGKGGGKRKSPSPVNPPDEHSFDYFTAQEIARQETQGQDGKASKSSAFANYQDLTLDDDEDDDDEECPDLEGFDEDDYNHDEGNEEDHILSFKHLFVDMISDDQLEMIWKSINAEEITLSEKEELAVLYAMEYLESKQIDEFEDAQYLEILSLQEAQRLEQQEQESAYLADLKRAIEHSSGDTGGKSGKADGPSSTLSTQEMALQVVFDTFKDSNFKNLTRERTKEILEECEYDVEEAISLVCQELLHNAHLLQLAASKASKMDNIIVTKTIPNKEGGSSSTKSGKSNKGKNKGNNSGKYSTPSSTKLSTTTTSTTVSSSNSASSSFKLSKQQGYDRLQQPATIPVKGDDKASAAAANIVIGPQGTASTTSVFARISLKKDPQLQYRFGQHFLNVTKTKNPLMQVELSPDGELVYSGMEISLNKQSKYNHLFVQNVLTITIDLHGLPVIQALQLVESSIYYYRCLYDGVNNKIERVTITYIVGKGLHSTGGIPKIKPAVLNLLQEKQEMNYVLFEGRIMLSIAVIRYD